MAIGRRRSYAKTTPRTELERVSRQGPLRCGGVMAAHTAPPCLCQGGDCLQSHLPRRALISPRDMTVSADPLDPPIRWEPSAAWRPGKRSAEEGREQTSGCLPVLVLRIKVVETGPNRTCTMCGAQFGRIGRLLRHKRRRAPVRKGCRDEMCGRRRWDPGQYSSSRRHRHADLDEAIRVHRAQRADRSSRGRQSRGAARSGWTGVRHRKWRALPRL